MDALQYLILEHESHKQLLNQIPDDLTLYTSFRQELIHHVNMEEAVFYPNLLRVKELESIVREAWEEHNLIMQLLQELDDLSQNDPTWLAKFEVLKKLLLLHIDEEEKELFPKIRSRASREFLYDVGEQMEVQKTFTKPDEILYPEKDGIHKIN